MDWVDQALRDNACKPSCLPPARPRHQVRKTRRWNCKADRLAGGRGPAAAAQASTLEAFYLHEQAVLKEGNSPPDRLTNSGHAVAPDDGIRSAQYRDRRLPDEIRGGTIRRGPRKVSQGRGVQDVDPSPDDRRSSNCASRFNRGATWTPSPPCGPRRHLRLQEAARSVAAIEMHDPRSLMAHRMVESLVAVAVRDARAATALFSDRTGGSSSLVRLPRVRGAAACRIRRKWIRPKSLLNTSNLLRRVSQGVLTSVDQLRSQSSSSRSLRERTR